MDSKQTFLFRIRILSFLTILVGAFFLAKLFSLQVIKQEAYAETADRSYVKSSDTFDRGSIYFKKRDGSRISAATVKTGYLLAMNPTLVKDANHTYEQISSVVDIDRTDFIDKADKENDPYEEIADEISREEADAITALGLPGVTLYKHKWRFYPGETMASQTIGFLGFGGGDTLSNTD